MANELTMTGGNELTAKLRYAETLAKSDLLPDAFKRNPGNVIWAIEFGEALGIPAITAINGIHVIKGKVTASANLISALVRRAGHKLRVTATDTTATATIFRCDDPDFPFTATWTMDRARQAGLTGNPTWKNFPASMLKSRAITECARMACEEALNGIHYTPEELGAEVDGSGIPTQVTVVQPSLSVEAVKWPDSERIAFCAELTRMGLKYEPIADWCETLGRPRPSLMTPDKRTALIKALGNGMRATFNAWLLARSKPAEASQVQDAELHGESAGDAAGGQQDGSGCGVCNATGKELRRGVCYDCASDPDKEDACKAAAAKWEAGQ